VPRLDFIGCILADNVPFCAYIAVLPLQKARGLSPGFFISCSSGTLLDFLPRQVRGFLFVDQDMTTDHQAIVDLPMWLLILVAMSGLVGEMRQADVRGIAISEIIRRVLLRFGSSALFGMATLMLGMAFWKDVYIAGAAGILIGLIGADVSGVLYTRWLAAKAGIDYVDRRGGQSPSDSGLVTKDQPGE
jgi:hypothetical protein